MQVGDLVKTLPTAGKQLIGVVIDTDEVLTQVLWNNGSFESREYIEDLITIREKCSK